MILESKKYYCNLDLYDSWVDKDEIINLYGILVLLKLHKNTYDEIILTMA